MKLVGELITGRPLVMLSPEATVLDAAKTMHKEHVGAVIVAESTDKLLGCFTERDLLTRVIVAGKNPADVRLADVMTTDLYTVHPQQRVNEVGREMQARHIRHLPVVDGGKLVAMLSLRDILREHIDAKRHEVQALTAYIQGENEPPGPEDALPPPPRS